MLRVCFQDCLKLLDVFKTSKANKGQSIKLYPLFCILFRKAQIQKILCSTFHCLVEMTGIEPVSEKRLQRLSSSVVIVLKFPQLIAQRQAINLGILKVMTRYKALPCSRSPLIDAY